ncbi:uncharacterized protein LOC141904171 isoform X2 [Tubulanus polymorphus]
MDTTKKKGRIKINRPSLTAINISNRSQLECSKPDDKDDKLKLALAVENEGDDCAGLSNIANKEGRRVDSDSVLPSNYPDTKTTEQSEEEEILDYNDYSSESDENQSEDDEKSSDDNELDTGNMNYSKKDLPKLVEMSIKDFVSQKIQQLEEERIRGELSLAEIEEKMKKALHARQKGLEIEGDAMKNENVENGKNEIEDDSLSKSKTKKKKKKDKKERRHKKKKKEEKKESKGREKERKHEKEKTRSRSSDQVDTDNLDKRRHRSSEKCGQSFVSKVSYENEPKERIVDLCEQLDDRKLFGTSKESANKHRERKHSHRSRSRSREKEKSYHKEKEQSHSKREKYSKEKIMDDGKSRKRSRIENEDETYSKSSKHVKTHHEKDKKDLRSESLEHKKVKDEKCISNSIKRKVSISENVTLDEKKEIYPPTENKNKDPKPVKEKKTDRDKCDKKSSNKKVKDVKNHVELSKVRTDLEHRVMEASDSEEETDEKIDVIVEETKFRSFSKPLNRVTRLRKDAGRESKAAEGDDNVEMTFVEEEDKDLASKKKKMEEKMRKAAENNKKIELEKKVTSEKAEVSDTGQSEKNSDTNQTSNTSSNDGKKQDSKSGINENKKVNILSGLKISLPVNSNVSQAKRDSKTGSAASITVSDEKENNNATILKEKKPMIPRVLGLKISEKSAELISSGEKVLAVKDTTDSVEEGELTESNGSEGEASSSDENEEGEIDDDDDDDDNDDEGLVEEDDDDVKDNLVKKKKKKSSKDGKSKKKLKKSGKTSDKKKGKDKSKDKKKKDKSRSRTPKKKKHSTRSRSRSRSIERDSRRHRHSRSRSPDDFWRGSDRYGHWRDTGSYYDRDHRDYRRRSRSPPFHRGRARERRSRSPSLQIDKEALRKIAVANAMKNFRTGQGPAANLRPDEIARIKSGGKSVAELTEFCKKITQKGGTGSDGGDEDEFGNLIGSDDDEGPFINHPFKVRENSSIVMNIKNAKQLPVLTPAEKKAQMSQLRIQFPVSSGNQHRTKELEWVPVEKPTPPVTTTAVAVVTKSAAPVAAVPAIPAISGISKDQSASFLMPPPPPPPPPPKNDSVFEESVPEAINIGEMVSERLSAMKKLSKNPLDMEAMGKMYRAQAKVNRWAQAQNLPGQFTGSTGAKILSVEELEGDRRNQAWLKKDQFIRAPVINTGLGMALLQKMGWKPGEALGKNKEGQLEPLCMEIKMDRKGLSSSDEITRKVPIMLPKGKVPKDLSGKHPVSALTELCKKRRWGAPEFALADETGPDHKKNFLYKVTVNGVDYQPACGQANKKAGRAQAAAACLQALGLLPSA